MFWKETFQPEGSHFSHTLHISCLHKLPSPRTLNSQRPHALRFAHAWLPDSSSLTDEASLGLENGFKFLARQYLPWLLAVFLPPLLLSLTLCCYCCCKAREGARETTQGGEGGVKKIQQKQKFVGAPRKKQQPNKKQKQN